MGNEIFINPMDLTGHQILVTGVSSGIGREIALRIHELGARIIIADENEDSLQSICSFLGSRRITQYAFGIYNDREIEPNIKKITGEQGPFSGFVHCSGTGGARPLALTKPSFFQKMMNDNCLSFIETVRCITRKGSFLNGGSIVALSSVSSIRALKSKTAYCASKAALDAAVRCLAVELSLKRIRVNSILKGWVDSDMQKDFIRNTMDLDEGEDLRRQVLGIIRTTEVANLAAFLLSNATVTITGASVLLDGGYTI